MSVEGKKSVDVRGYIIARGQKFGGPIRIYKSLVKIYTDNVVL